MPNEGEMVPDGDTALTPVTETIVDENGNTTVIGYPPGSNQGYVGTPSTEPGPGLGLGEDVGV